MRGVQAGVKKQIFYPSAKDRAEISVSRFSPSFLVNKPITFSPFVWTEYF